MAKKNVLGRGLGALIADAAEEPVTREIVVSAIQELNLADIRPNPFQPRTEFDEEALSELAASIKAIGIVQPITVRAVEDGEFHDLDLIRAGFQQDPALIFLQHNSGSPFLDSKIKLSNNHLRPAVGADAGHSVGRVKQQRPGH